MLGPEPEDFGTQCKILWEMTLDGPIWGPPLGSRTGLGRWGDPLTPGLEKNPGSNKEGQKLLDIKNLGTSCGFSFVAFVGAFLYGFCGVCCGPPRRVHRLLCLEGEGKDSVEVQFCQCFLAVDSGNNQPGDFLFDTAGPWECALHFFSEKNIFCRF